MWTLRRCGSNQEGGRGDKEKEVTQELEGDNRRVEGEARD